MSVVALDREFASIFGAPVIRAVDTRIFALRYFTHCMQCGFCHDQCCSYGVDIDAANMERLRGLGAAFENFVGTPPSNWFEPALIDDAEFPSGRHGRTRAVAGKCVFAAPRGCKIHAFCLENGLDYHLYKPMVSILFPLTFEHGVLEPSGEVLDGTLICVGEGPNLYDGVRGELEYFFGGEMVSLLDLMSRSQNQAQNSLSSPAEQASRA